MAPVPFQSARYTLGPVLGEGGMGIVYEAFDAERQAHIALKTMRALDGDTLARFKQEFRAAHEVRHLNLVELGELGFEGGVWFLTMEIVLGGDFLEYVRPGYAPLAPFRPSIRRSSTGADAPGRKLRTSERASLRGSTKSRGYAMRSASSPAGSRLSTPRAAFIGTSNRRISV